MNSADGGVLRVSDNAMGMSYNELVNALRVGFPPKRHFGPLQIRHGNEDCVLLDRQQMDCLAQRNLARTVEHNVSVDVNKIASGDNDLSHFKV